MKINWGKGIFIFFGAFVVFMLCLVYIASNQKHELVTDNYYEKELEFKETLEKEKNTEQLAEKLSWKIEEQKFQITFPKELGNKISGKLIFFKPSNENDDQEISFQTTSNIYEIAIDEFSAGMYKVKIDYSVNDIEYYNEVEIVIP